MGGGDVNMERHRAYRRHRNRSIWTWAMFCIFSVTYAYEHSVHWLCESISWCSLHILVYRATLCMMIYCLYRIRTTDPGVVTAANKSQDMLNTKFRSEVITEESEAMRKLHERTPKGDLRWCMSCQHYKPDRAHHCSDCNQCVLLFDHHCPWTANTCIGFGNIKIFLVFLVYVSFASTWATTSTASHLISLFKSSEYDLGVLFETFGVTMELVGAIIGTGGALFLWPFTIKHYLFAINNLTTIESFYKELNPYYIDVATNFKFFFGPNWWLWPLPVVTTQGDGFSYRIREDAEPSKRFIVDLNTQPSVLIDAS